ncbi:MAG: 2-oxoacid:acceptor oxidoreductase family protein [Candidatus Eisenbacteria bacterium]|uniref:2-oxoacid:acceptor oxidoreductase family protein n=1 Tax=Eiseniibacteriota bacterium TaxID=2212470 RepID=A0A956SDK0_UNCEI|nr:2-oxoacid:acceptor oxidoreductase family protein [Candidatus Eisenbacteria bacterium]MCB9466197.1 2-oxoacid:acceptor oxidoreductase family protein [Candidatus Eisenbacteria bacterium]
MSTETKGTAFFQHFDRHAHGKGLKGASTHYCPGCGHGLIHKYLADAITELGIQDRTIAISPVGCSVFLYYYFDVGNTQAAHGRAPAVGLGHKLANPESIVVSYQGDGDLASIGMAEIMHAAQLGIPISVIFVNNAIYGMTGGQMAPTTLPGMKSTTSPFGRGAMEGPPTKMAELIAQLEAPVYVERTALFDQRTRKATQKAIKKILQLQMEGRGFGFVEVLSECPTHLKMTPTDAEEWVKNEMTKYFPIGKLKDETRDPWFHLEKPTFDPERITKVLEASAEAPPRHCKTFPGHLDEVDVALKLAGAGGDGAQTAALLLAKSAIHEGFDATHIPSYGPESRGGTSYADVHIAKEEVLSPASPRPHVLIAFNAPSLAKFGPTVRENGIIVYDSSVVSDVPKELPKGVKVFGVPCAEIAISLGRPVVKNVVALGALQEATAILSEETLLHSIREALAGKCAMIPVNEEAFQWGVRSVREGFTHLPEAEVGK